MYICSEKQCPYPAARLQTPATANSIQILQPTEADVITDTLLVTGETSIKNSLLNYRVWDSANMLIAAGYFSIRPSYIGEMHSFATTITIEKQPSTPTGYLEIFYKSTIDGSVTDINTIPLRFAQE